MSSHDRRARERAETRQRILDAAREMFVRLGYEATTMRAIAQRIEYTPTAIYHHFRNKETLLTELCSADLRSLAAAFQQIGQIQDPIERLQRLGEGYVAFALEHPMQYQLVFMTRRPESLGEVGIEIGNPSDDAYAFLRDTCAAAIGSGRLKPEFDDPDQLGQIVWASLHGLMALHIVKQGHGGIEWRDPRQTAQRTCAALLTGMLREECR